MGKMVLKQQFILLENSQNSQSHYFIRLFYLIFFLKH